MIRFKHTALSQEDAALLQFCRQTIGKHKLAQARRNFCWRHNLTLLRASCRRCDTRHRPEKTDVYLPF